MIFNDRIDMVMNKAPDGWSQKLSLKQQAKLDEERKKYYKPLFAKYRTKKVRDYDYDTGAFCGWKPIQIGIGDPVGYEYVGYFAARMIDQINSSNIIMKRVLSR
jgi:hypothetical protein